MPWLSSQKQGHLHQTFILDSEWELDLVELSGLICTEAVLFCTGLFFNTSMESSSEVTMRGSHCVLKSGVFPSPAWCIQLQVNSHQSWILTTPCSESLCNSFLDANDRDGEWKFSRGLKYSFCALHQGCNFTPMSLPGWAPRVTNSKP